MKTMPWIKRDRIEHHAIPGENKTLCGKPMLGNNYVNSLKGIKCEFCPKCAEAYWVRAKLEEEALLTAAGEREVK